MIVMRALLRQKRGDAGMIAGLHRWRRKVPVALAAAAPWPFDGDGTRGRTRDHRKVWNFDVSLDAGPRRTPQFTLRGATTRASSRAKRDSAYASSISRYRYEHRAQDTAG